MPTDPRAAAIEAAEDAIGGDNGRYVLPLDIVDDVATDAVAAATSHLLEPIRELHRPDPHDRAFCRECDCFYPCPTTRALDAIEGGSR